MITLEFARTLYNDQDPVHDFDHVLRVLALARRIGQAEGADLAVVETAVLLHDIRRQDAGDHAAAAAEEARRLLGDSHPGAFVEAVAHAIAAHRFRSTTPPQTIEAQTVFDADKLDAIGAIGVARAYAYGARHGQKLWGEVPAGYAGDGLEHTPHHEFVYKLARITERLYTATGRAIAQERHAFMQTFFARLAAEVRGQE